MKELEKEITMYRAIFEANPYRTARAKEMEIKLRLPRSKVKGSPVGILHQ
jgi:hypothetical protein